MVKGGFGGMGTYVWVVEEAVEGLHFEETRPGFRSDKFGRGADAKNAHVVFPAVRVVASRAQ